MKCQNGYLWARYMLVGVLISGMAFNSVAAGRLFRRNHSCKCPTACHTVCPPAVCPVASPTVPADCCTSPTVVDGSCSAAEPIVADHGCQDCAPTSDDTTTGHNIPVHDPVLEESMFEPPLPIEVEGPSMVEQYGPSDAIVAPVEVPSNQGALAPAQVAVPEVNDVPATPPSAPVESPAAGVVGDRYSNDNEPLDPPAPAVSPEPIAEPPTTADEPNDPFDEPTPAVEEEPPVEEEPTPEDPQPILNDDDLFGPTATDETDDADDKPQDSEQPPSAEESEVDDLFGQESRPSMLTAAGGLQSDADRTWTDNTSAYQCRARLVHLTAKSVILQQSNGIKLAVPLTRLGTDDLQFVHQQVVALRVARARGTVAEKLAVAGSR